MSKLEQIKLKLAALIENNVITTTTEVKMGAIKTDKAVLEWDNTEDLVAGVPVYVTDENGEKKPVENGEYVTEDGKVIVVADGKVESITDPVAEVDGADEEKPIEEPTEVKKADEVENPDGGEEPTPDAVEELRKEVDELYKIVDSILDKIGETRREADERFKKIENASVAKPIETKEVDVKPTEKNDMFGDWRKM